MRLSDEQKLFLRMDQGRTHTVESLLLLDWIDRNILEAAREAFSAEALDLRKMKLNKKILFVFIMYYYFLTGCVGGI